VWRSRDVPSWALLIGTSLMGAVAVVTPDVLGRVGGMVAAIMCAVSWSFRRFTLHLREGIDSIGYLPMQVSIDQDDDGNVTALVTRMNGEPVVVSIPPTVAEQGREAVAHYLLHELEQDDDA
jgi:hypothetical protein